MIVLVALGEALTARFDLGCSNQDGVFWRYRARAAVRQAPGCRVLCFGDSLVKFAIDADVLGDRVGGRACNLAMPGGMAAGSYFQLRRALRAGARPVAVVVDYVPVLLGRELRDYVQVLPEVADLRDCLDLGWTMGDFRFAAKVALARVSATFRDREGIRALFSAALGQPAETTETEEPEAGRGRDVFDSILYPDSWSCAPLNAVYVRRFLDLATSRGLPVFWLIPPYRPGANDERERRGLEASYNRFVLGVQASYPGLVVVDGRRAAYGPAAYSDPIHMSRQGARAYSVDVADVLGLYLSRDPESPLPRWVDVPGKHEPGDELAGY
jgi:hypothetical protein